MADEPKVISTVKARGGVTPHVVRYVLIISLALAVAAMVFVYFDAPTASQNGPTSAPGPQ
jgi:hypothetical protein